MIQTRTRSRRPIALWGLVLGLLLATGASPALAHDELIGTDPAGGAVLASPPTSLTLTFSGILLDEEGATEVAVLDASGASLTDGDPVLDGVRVTQALTGEGSGTVTVQWRVVSSDGHPISGEYAFSVGDGVAPATPAPAEPADTFDPTLLLVVAAVLVSGVMVVLVAARKRGAGED